MNNKRSDILRLREEATNAIVNGFPFYARVCRELADRYEADEKAAQSPTAEQKLADAGVFAGVDGLRGLLESDAFWSVQPYGTRLYYGEGITEYLHRDVLRAAVELLDNNQQTQAPVVDEREKFEKWIHENSTNCDSGEWAAWQARAKLGQTPDKACSAVVPYSFGDELIRKIANSHTSNEGTDKPIWWIIDPRQMMSPCVHDVYSMFKGPFFSREAATEYMESHRYRYGKHVKVYCGSCNDAPEFRDLYRLSQTMTPPKQEQ